MSEVLAYRVVPLGLNIRSKPEVVPSTRLAVLPQGHIVYKTAETQDDLWWQVATILDNAPLVGFVNRAHLSPVEISPSPQLSNVPEVHLAENIATSRRDVATCRAYPIGEAGRPTRTGPTHQDKVNQLAEILAWLDVEHSRRYTPADSSTYCNIYACDYCYLASVYLPRVWWTARSLALFQNGQTVKALYNQTIRELNANSLFDWLVEFSGLYGWERVFDLTQIQRSVDGGMVGVVCGQNRDLNRSGHIAAVVPENADHKAVRAGNTVTKPLLSQAGARNRRYDTDLWWEMDQFRDHGMWLHP